jgi:flagellar hook-associated protein 2
VATIALPGLQTGIDTSAIISQLLAVARRPVQLLEQRQARWQQKADAFSALLDRLDALKTAVADIRYASELRVYAVHSNNDDAVTVEAGTGATEGTHEVVIDQLAAAEREVHAGVASSDTLVGAGTFAYTYNGQTRTIQTTAETTLAGLCGLINNDGGNPGLSASVLQYDAGGGQVYHLVLGGDDTGADYAIAIDDGLTTLDGTGGTVDLRQAAFTESQSARNSRLRVDNYPAGAWIERSTNTIDDVLDGVTLKLHAPGTVQVSLTRDTTGLKDRLTALVDAYNNIVDFAKEKTAYDAAAKTGGVLMGEQTVTYVRQQTRLPLVQGALGFLGSTDPFTLAGEIGLSVDRYGKLELDADVLDDALAEDYLGVLRLLGADRTGASNLGDLQYYGATSSTTPGAYSVRVTFQDGVAVSAQIKLATEGDGAWRDATVQGNLVIGADGHPEKGLRVTASHDGTGTVEAVVRVRQGIGGTLYDTLEKLLDTHDGALALAEQRCQDAIDNLQANIDRQEDRLARMGTRLQKQYAALERALAMLEAQRLALGTTS